MSAVRSYHEIIRRIQGLPRADWKAEWIGEVSCLPVYAARRSVADDAPSVLLTAGMHGDEPAGVEAALQWMEGGDWHTWPVNWLVLPCINPFGWAHDRRTNAEGQDINRHFLDSDSCPEAKLVKEATAHQRFILAMDLHEDSDATGYYLCETKTQPPFLGERIPQALSGVMPVADNARLDGRRAQGPGWVLRVARRNDFERRRQWPLAFHLAARGTEHFLCSETPTRRPLDLRVRAHLTVLREALRFVTETLPVKPTRP